jgi:hypothetical protein
LAVYLICLIAIACAVASGADEPSITRLPIGLAYASDAVNTPVFRVSAVLTAAGHQFATYYAPDGSVVVARREIRLNAMGCRRPALQGEKLP